VSDEAVAGVYGFRIAGVLDNRDLLVEARSNWPLLEVTSRVDKVDQRVTVVSEQHAELKLIEGITARLDRSPPRVEFITPTPLSSKAIVHPFLSGVVPIHCHWMGRTSLHGGAFIHDNRAWAILGDREGGKSTLLAQLAAQGLAIVADDLVVIEDDLVYAGPRSIDLRVNPAQGMGPADFIGRVGARERWRIQLGPIPSQVPLGGFFFLELAERSEIRRLAGVERMLRISAGRSLMLPLADPMTLPRLAALPGWEVLRSARFEDLPTITEQMLQAIAVA
jgi:hypothetical protein